MRLEEGFTGVDGLNSEGRMRAFGTKDSADLPDLLRSIVSMDQY
jgi:hypothetical protein